MEHEEPQKIARIIEQAQRIMVMQADNPDGDSLASALAMEQILGDLGKDVYLYCAIDMPAHLKHMPGWDRVNRDLPSQFDASIIVDTSADSLFELLNKSGQKGWVTAKPSIIIDHHAGESTMDWVSVRCFVPAVATGEVMYELAQRLDWPLAHTTCEFLASSILSDSLGLTTDATTARSIHIVAELVERGVSIAELENRRRETFRKAPRILSYKADLLKRIQYSVDGRVATVDIPWEEIEAYSQEYNPSVLVLDEMRLVEGVDIAVAFKIYKDNRYTAKIRANYGSPIGKALAEHFGGGGHPYASGFKVQDGRPFNEIKSECIAYAQELLDNLGKDSSDETLQHTYSI
ncbi:MAG TPA: DHH family phosphoesterase [Candidatus Microsaccharimonas sp.]|nr:DHH family phosphoesterase [Candidatus Microsaccharimonas sp.]